MKKPPPECTFPPPLTGILTTGIPAKWEPVAEYEPIQLPEVEYVDIPATFGSLRGRPRIDMFNLTGRDKASLNSALIRGYDLIYPDPETAVALCSDARGIVEQVAAQSTDKGVAIGEWDVGEKLTIQRRAMQDWFIGNHDPGPTQPSALWLRVLDIYVHHLARQKTVSGSPKDLILLDRDPPDTNQGMPTMSSQPAMRALTLDSIGMSDWANLGDFLYPSTEMWSELELDAKTMWSAALAKRSGPTTKPLPIRIQGPTGVQEAGRATGLYTRSRLVYMVPFPINMLLAPLALPLKSGRLGFLGGNHSAEGVARYSKWIDDHPDYEILESDISGFDTSITPAHRAALYNALERAGFFKPSIDLLRWLDEDPKVLSQPWEFSSFQATLYTGPTGLLSGLKMTSDINSGMCAVTVVKALIEAGVLSESEAKNEWPFFLFLGDDVLLFTPKGKLKPDQYEASFAEEGLKAKVLTGRRFLMQHFIGSTILGVTSRLIQQTMFNEDSYSHVGQIHLGLAARLSRPYHPDHSPMILSWLNLMSSTNLGPLFKQLAELAPEARSPYLMATPEVPAFLSSAEGVTWLTDLAADSAVSQSSATMYALTQRYGYSEDTVAAEQHRAALVAAMFNHQDVHASRRELRKLIWKLE
jgi:hypothetical protein